MSLQCSHWATVGVIEQHKKALEKEMNNRTGEVGGLSSNVDLGLLPSGVWLQWSRVHPGINGLPRLLQVHFSAPAHVRLKGINTHLEEREKIN